MGAWWVRMVGENGVVKRLLVSIVAAAFVVPMFAKVAAPDPLFAKVRFDDWKAEKGPVPFQWTVDIEPILLSNHQRWLTRINVRIDGNELMNRKGKGALFVLFQFQDGAGDVYQDHGVLDLRKVEAGAKAQIIIYTESAFVQPGNYPLAIGIFDTNTSDHWLRRNTLKVPVFKGDPLPYAWRDLPPVEFHPQHETPDSWFLPTVTGKLNLPLETKHPLKVEVLVNLTPSELAASSQRILDRNLSTLLPTVKFLSQLEMTKGTLNVELLDMQRQKVSFRQEAVKQIDWPKMRDALTADQIGTIDVKALGDRDHSAQFFLAEVAKRVRTADVLIILSSSVRFEVGMDLEPLHAQGTPDCRVYYFRYHPPPVRYVVQQRAMVRRGPSLSSGQTTVLGPHAVDQLEATLKQLKHRLYDVQNPEEMRKALADLMAELSVL
jgi:Cu/Ag efflux protein CusF